MSARPACGAVACERLSSSMTPLFLDLTRLEPGDATCFFYRLAGQLVQSNFPVPELEPFSTTPREDGLFFVPNDPKRQSAERAGSPVFCGDAWLAGRIRRIECWAEHARFDISVAGIGRFAVDHPKSHIELVEIEQAVALPELVETLAGPPLIVALAGRGIHCLHASAVLIGDRAVAIAGASGLGKSTLARSLSAQSGSPYSLLADDILPIHIEASQVQALPRYPQLKYAIGRQPSLLAPEAIPLVALYVLQAQNDQARPARVETMSPRSAVVEIMRNTVACRLFDRGLMSEHFRAATFMAENTPVRFLHYPHTDSSVGEVYEALLQDMNRIA